MCIFVVVQHTNSYMQNATGSTRIWRVQKNRRIFVFPRVPVLFSFHVLCTFSRLLRWNINIFIVIYMRFVHQRADNKRPSTHLSRGFVITCAYNLSKGLRLHARMSCMQYVLCSHVDVVYLLIILLCLCVRTKNGCCCWSARQNYLF